MQKKPKKNQTQEIKLYFNIYPQFREKNSDYSVVYILNMTIWFSFIKTTNSSGKKYHIIAFYI